MEIEELDTTPIKSIAVRGFVHCGNKYIFIKRTRPEKKKHYTVFPGGRLRKSDRIKGDKKNIGKTLKEALRRELQEELAAREIVVGDLLDVRKSKRGSIEVLYHVDVASIDWENKTGKEFSQEHKGTYELVEVESLDKKLLGSKGYRLKPRKWKKLILNRQSQFSL